MDVGPPELLIIAIVLLVVFGGSQIPKLAKNLGSAQAEFKKGLAEANAAAKQADAPTEQPTASS